MSGSVLLGAALLYALGLLHGLLLAAVYDYRKARR